MRSSVDHSSTSRRLLIGGFFLRHLGLEGVGTFIAGLAQGMTACGWDVSLVLPAGSHQHLPGMACCRKIMTYPPGVGAIRTYGRIVADAGSRHDRVLLVENNPNSLAAVSRLSGIALSDARVVSYLYTPLLCANTIRALQWRLQAWLHVAAKWHQWARLTDWRKARIIVASTFQREQLRRLGARCVAVIRASVIPRDSSPRTENDAGATMRRVAPPGHGGSRADRPFAVGYLGHFSPAKGVGVLLDAFRTARRRRPMRLIIAHSGKGRLHPRHQAVLRRLVAEQSVQMETVVDPVRFLAECDVTVLPYPSSSIHHPPLVLIESMAAGTPVLTTDVGGLPEVVAHGETGFLVPPGDAARLADRITWLAGHPEATGRMGSNARQQFEQSLCREVCCGQLDRILRGDQDVAS